MNTNTDKGRVKNIDLNDFNISNINRIKEKNPKEKSEKNLFKEYNNEKNDFNISSIRDVVSSHNYNSSHNNNYNPSNTDKEKDINKFELMRKLEAKLNCPTVVSNQKEQEQVYSRPSKNIKDFQSQSIVSSNNNPISIDFETKIGNNLSKRIEKLK